METEMVVCNIYKLFRNGKSFTKEGKKLERSNIVIRRDYADEKNDNWMDNGLWHEIDEDATELFYEKREKIRLDNIKKQKISKKVAENLTNMLDLDTDDVVVEKPKVKKEVKVDEIDVVDEEEVKDEINITGLGNLKVAYLEKFGKHVPVNKKNDEQWILDKLNDR